MLTSSGGRSMLTVADKGEGGGGVGVKFAKILLTSYVNAPYMFKFHIKLVSIKILIFAQFMG